MNEINDIATIFANATVNIATVFTNATLIIDITTIEVGATLTEPLQTGHNHSDGCLIFTLNNISGEGQLVLMM